MPAGEGPWPGLLLVHEIFGLDDEMMRHADTLAAMGYLVVAPDLLARGRRVVCLAQTMTALRKGRGRAFDDLEAGRSALLADPACNGSVGVIGFCLGGGFALVLAGRPGWDAVAANYGALPQDLAALDGACPVVASYGGRDLYLRGAASTLETALTERGVEHDVQGVPRRRARLPQRDRERALVHRADVAPRAARRARAGLGAGRVGADRVVPRAAPHQVTAPRSRQASSRPVGSSTVPPRFHSAR